MSNLKYLNVDELEAEIAGLDRYIAKLNNKVNGAKQRREWAAKYLFEKTPQELSIRQIESLLGHKVIISDIEEND